MKILTVVANIKAKKDQIDFVRTELESLIDVTRKEKGCIQYDLHLDNENPAHFLFFENWETKEHWLKHMETEHLKRFLSKTTSAIEEFVVNEMTKIG